MESFANTRYNTYIMRMLVSVAGAEEDGWLVEGMLYVESIVWIWCGMTDRRRQDRLWRR